MRAVPWERGATTQRARATCMGRARRQAAAAATVRHVARPPC